MSLQLFEPSRQKILLITVIILVSVLVFQQLSVSSSWEQMSVGRIGVLVSIVRTVDLDYLLLLLPICSSALFGPNSINSE